MQTEVEKFMRQALDLAKKAEGQTFPNPLVGAILVRRGRIVGQGFHRRAGGPHAEILALQNAGDSAQGAILFCTLEPCAHYGRTGPCANEIIKAGIKEVYVGMVDPNPLTRGKGIRALQAAGIKVQSGFLKKEAARLNEPFVQAMTKHRPLVTIKVAESLDGKIATRRGDSKWITGEYSRRYAHWQRRFYDAIMVGLNTVLKDDPNLEPGSGRQHHRLIKIIADSGLKIPLTARLFRTRQPVIIAAIKSDPTKERRLLKMGARVIHTRSDRGRVDLGELLKKLNGLEVRNLLVEGGSELIGSFLDEKLADKALFFIAPKIIGGRCAVSAVRGEGVGRLSSAISLEQMSLKRLKSDILIEGDLRY